jgi:signal transduction histidine kinase
MRERTGVAVTLDIDFDLGRFPQALELAVFRIVQEALTNVHRHARTSEVFVRIHRHSTLLLVEIEDRGRGISQFTSVARQNTGLGLRGMRERVNQLSGEFVVESGRGGTTVKATFPIPDATNSDAWSEV